MENNSEYSSNFQGLDLPLEMTEEEREIAKMLIAQTVPIDDLSLNERVNFSWFQFFKAYLQNFRNARSKK